MNGKEVERENKREKERTKAQQINKEREGKVKAR